MAAPSGQASQSAVVPSMPIDSSCRSGSSGASEPSKPTRWRAYPPSNVTGQAKPSTRRPVATAAPSHASAECGGKLLHFEHFGRPGRRIRRIISRQSQFRLLAGGRTGCNLARSQINDSQIDALGHFALERPHRVFPAMDFDPVPGAVLLESVELEVPVVVA